MPLQQTLPQQTKPLQQTKRAAKRAARQITAACDRVRGRWTEEERLHRRNAASQMQTRLVAALGLGVRLAPAPTRR